MNRLHFNHLSCATHLVVMPCTISSGSLYSQKSRTWVQLIRTYLNGFSLFFLFQIYNHFRNLAFVTEVLNKSLLKLKC